MKTYVAGNWLRGYFEGEFETLDEAWSYLSNRFLLAYPSAGGRHISMWVREPNTYGVVELVCCKFDVITEINDLPEDEVKVRCKRSIQSHL